MIAISDKITYPASPRVRTVSIFLLPPSEIIKTLCKRIYSVDSIFYILDSTPDPNWNFL